MSKNAYYFSHDYDTREDEKIKKLMYKHGWSGYGIYWALIEALYINDGYLQLECDRIAFELRAESDTINSIINDFGLFKIKENAFYSESVSHRLKKRKSKSFKARESAQSRWDKEKQNDANALRIESERNAIKERKGKEIKGKENKGNITMSELSDSDDLEENEKIALSFWNLSSAYMDELEITSTDLKNAKYKNWVDPVRLSREKDGRTTEEFREIFNYLANEKPGKDGFTWKQNIRSGEKLREKFEQILIKSRKANNDTHGNYDAYMNELNNRWNAKLNTD
jgi:hypothetical protein